MASVSPTLPPLAGLAGNPRTFVRGGAVASTDTLGTAGVILNFQGLTLSIYFFSAVSDTDTWDASSTIAPPKRALACAWQGDDVDDDLAWIDHESHGADLKDLVELAPVTTGSLDRAFDGYFRTMTKQIPKNNNKCCRNGRLSVAGVSARRFLFADQASDSIPTQEYAQLAG